MDNGKIKKYKNVLFADLDGTLINTIFGKDFPIACYDIAMKWDTLEAIKQCKPEVVVIVSNQGGIEAGFVNPNFFHNKIMWVSSVVAEYCKCDCLLDYCPTNDKNNIFRKPNPGMVNKFIEKECDIDENFIAVMIGDRDEDRKCAENANIKYFDVKEFITKFSNIEPV